MKHDSYLELKLASLQIILKSSKFINIYVNLNSSCNVNIRNNNYLRSIR